MIRTAGVVLAVALAGSTAAVGQTVERQGRFSLSPAEGGGFVRLDTQTGSMSLCQRREGDWSCRDMQDDGGNLRQENERLARENRELKDELKRLEDFVVGEDGPSGKERRAERPGGAFPLPSEQDVDKAFDYFDRMLKKFRDKLKELEGGGKGSTPL